ncbi:MAG: transposase [Bacteroidota bacterium]
MKCNRHSIRLKDYDYTTPWWYYVTICTDDHKLTFGKIKNGKVELNHLGKIANECWQNIPEHFPQTVLDYYIIMPNHIHGITVINSRGTTCRALTTTNLHYTNNEESFGKPVKGSLPMILRSYKAAVTKRINEIKKTDRGIVCKEIISNV